MAILKHISIKNKAYSDSAIYLWFKHDKETGEPLQGENGHFIRRDGVIMDSLNCGIFSFGFDCRMANKEYGKNQGENDIRAHHWILTFDPKDAEYGLTMEKAQELGMEFARKHFGGHQCLIATHNDGHNGSKNIHVHIVCNSLRIKDLPEQPAYSTFERDRKAGYKLHPTREMMEYLKDDVMQLCREHGLHQVELNKPAKKHITDKEYRAQQRGQERLDKANEAIITAGGTPKQTKFQTELERMREAIDTARQRAISVEDFKRILEEEYQIIVTESRGRWSYLPSNRKRPVSWRRLGTDYQREFIETYIVGQEREKQESDMEYKSPETSSQDSHDSQSNTISHKIIAIHQVSPVATGIMATGRLIDLNDPKIKDSYGLTQWAKLQNLKKMSHMFNVLSESGMLNMDLLSDEIASQKAQFKEGQEELKSVEGQLKEVNQLRRLLAQYYSTRDIYKEYRRRRKSTEFREQHISEITLYEGVQKQLKAWQQEHGGIKIPSDTQLKKEKAIFSEKKDRLYKERRELRDSIKALEESYNLFATAGEKKRAKHLEVDRN